MSGWAAAPPQKKKTAAPVKATAPAKKKTAPVKTAAKRTAGHQTRTTHTGKKTTTHAAAPTRASWRAGQTAPTPERYKQFQEALIAKGYLQGEATGHWDEASADAMRRFQKDQNLQPTGKPDQSLTIIALGLGPKY